MKALKWVLGIAIIIALVAIIVHLRRDSIARDIANSILDEQGFSATELEVRSLSPNRLVLETLVIESESGARYEISGLSLPLTDSSDGRTHVTAAGLTITYATERDRQTLLSTTLDTVFGLPVSQTNFEAQVDSIKLPQVPPLKNANLHTDNDRLVASFAVDDIQVAAALTTGQSDGNKLIAGAKQDDVLVMSLDLDFTRIDERYHATGDVTAVLAAWLPTLQGLNLVPPGIDRLDVSFAGAIDIRLDEVSAGNALIGLDLNIADDATARYVSGEGRTSEFVAATVDSLAIEFHYPANRWTAQFGPVAGNFETDGLSKTPVVIEDLECQSGISCNLKATTNSQAVTWNDYNVESATVSLPMGIVIGEPTRIEIAPAATGEFVGFNSEGITAAAVRVAGFSGTDILLDDDGWRTSIDTLQLAFDDLAAPGELTLSPAVTLNNLNVNDSGAALDAEFLISAPLYGSRNNVSLTLPGAAGSLTFAADELVATIDVVDLNDAVAGSVVWTRNTATDAGSLLIKNGWASFDRARLSDYAPGWQTPADILQGDWDIDLELQWESINGVPLYRGTTSMTLNGIGGTYTDIAMVGLTTALAGTIDPAEGLRLQTAPVSIRLLDVGIPIENISFEYQPDVAGGSIEVAELSLEVFGGKVQANPFVYATASPTNDITLRAEDIQLQLMVDTLGFESIEMTGTVSGDLPIVLTENEITIRDGRFDGSNEGGIIRYQSGDPTGLLAEDSGLGALAALTNFEYESLTSTVNYVEGGSMQVQMRLVGINPDFDPTQPFAYNLNLDNNIPQMLRSLRAVRSIEDILKQRTVN